MFIPLNLAEAKELKPVPMGRYDLTIATCEEGVSKKGNPQFKVTMNIEGHDEAPAISHWVSIPGADGDEPKTTEFKMLLLRRFLDLFGVKVASEGFDTERLAMELPGCTARSVEVQVDGDFNNIVVPKLRGEASATGKTSAQAPKS